MITTDAVGWPERLGEVLLARNQERKFFVVIPGYATLTEAERVDVDSGGRWPIRIGDYLLEHEHLIDFLIERSLEAWTSSPV